MVPRNREVQYLYHLLILPKNLNTRDEKFFHLLTLYSAKKTGNFIPEDIQKAINQLKKADYSHKFNKTRAELILFIHDHEKDISQSELLDYIFIFEKNNETIFASESAGQKWYKNKNFSTAIFSTTFERSNSEFPLIFPSQNYNPTDPDSPVICVMIPSMATFKLMQKVIYKDDAQMPYFSAGSTITPRMIKDLDKKGFRPIELVSDDIKASEYPHGFNAHHFELTWHDLYHNWVSSVNYLKPFHRHLRDMLEQERGYDMSSAIWYLSDLDITFKQAREKNIDLKLKKIWSMQICHAAFIQCAGNYWQNTA